MFDIKKSDRGFAAMSFKDSYGAQCSLQESSLSIEGGAVWLGVDDAGLAPKIMAQDARRLGLPDKGEAMGWVDYDLPKDVLVHSRMHLTRDQAKKLIEALEYFVDTGELPGRKND